MRSDHPQLVRFAGRNDVEQTVNLLLTTRKGFADLSWSDQVFQAGQHLRTLTASTKAVKLSAGDERMLRLKASSDELKKRALTGDVDDDALLEKMMKLAERIAAAVKAKDIETLRKLAPDDDDDDVDNPDNPDATALATAAGRQAAIRDLPGRNELERAMVFLSQHPATREEYARTPARLHPFCAGRFLNAGQLSGWEASV